MLRNLTLSAMNPADLAALIPHLTERHVQKGDVLISQGALVETVGFPSTAFLTNTVSFSDGRSAETFVMGVEGVTGLAPFLAERPCAWSVEVKAPGAVYEAPAVVLRRIARDSPTLNRQLIRLLSDYHALASMGAACAALHHATGRLARFLLVAADRTRSEQLQFTQEDIAGLLGFQRTTVNASAKELKSAGAISYVRGRLRITDRPALTRAACECYRLQSDLLH